MRCWIQEEYELLKAEERDQPRCGPGGWILAAKSQLSNRLICKHRNEIFAKVGQYEDCTAAQTDAEYKDFYRLLSEWLSNVASAAELRDYAGFKRRMAAHVSLEEKRSGVIAEAAALEQLALARKEGTHD